MNAARRGLGPSTSGRCRSCGQPVEWLEHHVTHRLAPLQPAPTGVPGNIAVNADGEYLIVPAGEGDLVNHFSQCEFASHHHKEAP